MRAHVCRTRACRLVAAAVLLVGTSALQAQLIGKVDYSDTFTVAEQGGASQRTDGSLATGSPASDVEDSHGNPPSTWLPGGTFSFNTGPGTAGFGYPGSEGNPGASTGLAQSGGGDFSFAYGVRAKYVVSVDAILPLDRLDLSSFSAAGNGLGSPGSLSVFFRRDDIAGNLGYPGIGVYKEGGPETAVTDGVGTPVWTGVADDKWHNFAVLFDQTNGSLEFFVDGASLAAVDLNTFGGGVYRDFSNGAVGTGGAGYDFVTRVLWVDNFQVGAPAAVTEACFSASAEGGLPPLTVDFDASCSVFEGAPRSYTWDFGDGANGSGVTVTHVFSTAGSHEVALTIEDSGGTTATARKTVTVFTAAESFTDAFERPDDVVDGWTVYAVPDTWNLQSGTLTTGPTAEERWIWAGDPPVFLPERTTIEFDMSFRALGTNMEVGRHAGAVFCASKPTHRHDAGFNGYILGWIDRPADRGLWFMKVTNGTLPPNATVGGGALPEPPLTWRVEITASQILIYGDDVLYITVDDAEYRGGFAGLWTWEGGQEVAFDNYSAKPPASVLRADFTVAPQFAVAGDPVTFDGTLSESIGGTINAYEWDLGDGTTATTSTVTHAYAAAGDYTVKLTVRDDVHAPASVERIVSVHGTLAPFADCFDRPEGLVDGWTAASGTWNITADGWVEIDTVTGGAEGFLYAGDPPRALPREFAAELDWSFVTAIHPDVGRHASVNFFWNYPTTNRFAADARGYTLFFIDRESDRGLTLHRWDNGVLTALNPPGGTPAITAPPSTIRIEVDGPTIRVLADGVPAVEAHDETYRDGLFGLWAYSYNQVRFDNVRLGVDELPSCGGVPETTFKRGDTNADGRTNIADAICLLGYLFGQNTDPCKTGVPRCRDVADANNDGNLNIADAIKILGYLFNFAQTGNLPEPFLACGADPADPPDTLDCGTYTPCAK